MIIGGGWAFIGQFKVNVEKRKYDGSRVSYGRGS